jgi:vacuolar iron transporter family protein
MFHKHKRGHRHSTSEGKYLKSIVYGGLDGIITTFAIVAGVAGAALSSSVILILGFANLIADGISMAAGDFLSSKAEAEYLNKKSSKKGATPLKKGLTTFTSFVIFGFIPLLTYVVAIFNPSIAPNTFKITLGLTAIALFTLGVIKAEISHKNKIKSGIETLVIGGAAATAAYYIGHFLAELL